LNWRSYRIIEAISIYAIENAVKKWNALRSVGKYPKGSGIKWSSWKESVSPTEVYNLAAQSFVGVSF
jgi:hypothetical protein